MSLIHRLLSAAAVAAFGFTTHAANPPKDSPFGQAGSNVAAPSSTETIEFAGVSTMGKKTMINLYDKQEKRSFWIEAGKTSSGITVVKYDAARDQVVIRQNGADKTLSLRAASGVVSGSLAPAPMPSAAPAPVTAPAIPVAGAPTTAAIGPTAPTNGATTATTTAGAPTPTGMMQPQAPLSQARQEEEARMLVSDLLEIGMAQRRAYEEAQRRAASGQPPQSAPATTTAQTGQPAAPQSTTTPTP